MPDNGESVSVSELEDRELIKLCRGNGSLKEQAWEEVVRRFRRRVFGIAYKFTGRYEESQDLTQEIFLRVFRSLDKFDANADFGTWLYSVSRNHCIDHYRSGRREREALIDREVNLEDDGEALLLSGANGIISAGYLTLNGNEMKKDLEMIKKINLEA